MLRSIAHYTVLSGHATAPRPAVHRGITGVIVSMMERQSGPGERLGLSLCGLAMWRASSRVTLISLEKQGSAKYNAAQCHTEFCKGKFVSMDSSSVYKFINDLLLNLMNFTRLYLWCIFS